MTFDELFIDPQLCLPTKRVVHAGQHDEEAVSGIGRLGDRRREVRGLA